MIVGRWYVQLSAAWLCTYLPSCIYKLLFLVLFQFYSVYLFFLKSCFDKLNGMVVDNTSMLHLKCLFKYG